MILRKFALPRDITLLRLVSANFGRLREIPELTSADSVVVFGTSRPTAKDASLLCLLREGGSRPAYRYVCIGIVPISG